MKKAGAMAGRTKRPEAPATCMEALQKRGPTTMPAVYAVTNMELAAVRSLPLKHCPTLSMPGVLVAANRTAPDKEQRSGQDRKVQIVRHCLLKVSTHLSKGLKSVFKAREVFPGVAHVIEIQG